jgi:hypothetical protein
MAWKMAKIGEQLRILRLPSFRTAYLASVAVLLAFATWAFVDASFDNVLQFVRIDLRINEHPGTNLWPVHQWDALGPRLLLFCMLAVVVTAAGSLIIYRLVLGDPQGRSMRAMLLAVALFGMWLSLFVSYSGVAEAGLRWRVRRILPCLKEDAAILAKKWPKMNGRLACSGHLGFSLDGDATIIYID